jgi:predicted phosphodiesterase
MRLLVTADLHFNHPRSRALAEELIGRMNQSGGDVLLLVGDTTSFDGDALERCLSLFQFNGPKLFVAGNHELWTYGPDSLANHDVALPRRVEALGWQWIAGKPFVNNDLAIVGSMGWYDFSFAQPNLGVPKRFYQAKVSPGVAARYEEYAALRPEDPDVLPQAREIIARWNDGRFVKLGMSDEQFLDRLLETLKQDLEKVKSYRTVFAAIHHLPFRELLPPPHSAQWDFAKAYLGSERIGELLLKYPNVTQSICGHSHFAAEATVGHIHAINIGSGYRAKSYKVVDL